MKNTFFLLFMMVLAIGFTTSCTSDAEVEQIENAPPETMSFSVEVDGSVIETTPSARPVYTGPLTPIGTIPEDCIRWEVVWRYTWQECGDQYQACAGIVSSHAECIAAMNNCINNMHTNQVVCSTDCAPAVCWG